MDHAIQLGGLKSTWILVKEHASQLMQILHIDYTLLGFESRLGHNAVGDNQLLQPVRLLVSPNNIRLTFYRSTE